MLRIIVELHSARTGQRKQIGMLDICNTGTGSEARGNYIGKLYRRGDARQIVRVGEVTKFPRKSYVVWRLILRMLRNMFPEEK